MLLRRGLTRLRRINLWIRRYPLTVLVVRNSYRRSADEQNFKSSTPIPSAGLTRRSPDHSQEHEALLVTCLPRDEHRPGAFNDSTRFCCQACSIGASPNRTPGSNLTPIATASTTPSISTSQTGPAWTKLPSLSAPFDSEINVASSSTPKRPARFPANR